MNSVLEQLLILQDEKFKDFNKKIVNTNYEMIGVRTDALKKIAKKNIDIYEKYFYEKHQYYEEYMIHGYMLGYLKLPITTLKKYIDDYIEDIDCWSMVDQVVSNLKILKNDLNSTFEIAKEYINSSQTFKIRFGYCILLTYFVNQSNEQYIDEILLLCNKTHNQFYVQMMVAWLLSVVYVKFKEKALLFMNECKLDDFTYNKTISKICDSYRVTQEEKNMLKNMRRK